MIQSKGRIKRLPPSLLFGATRLAHGWTVGNIESASPESVRQELGIRRINDKCVELESFDNNQRNLWASAIGMMILFSIGGAFFLWLILTYGSSGTPRPLSLEVWLKIVLVPWISVALAFIFYVVTGASRTRGAFIRLNRITRKLYYVAPRKAHVTVLDWDSLVPLAGYVPIASQTSFTTRHPLYLIGVDDGQSPSAETCIACGNMGWRDEGDSAKQLWEYLQHFMENGVLDLPQPPPVPQRGTRQQAFTRLFHEWAAKFRKDLPTIGSCLRSPFHVCGRVIWLIFMTFPDSLAEWIQYNVPYAQFPKEIDRLCGFEEKPTPVICVNGERIDP